MTNSDPGNPLTGTPFAKMTGSGNDFVFFDGRQVDLERVTRPEVIRAICNRHNGIGADGLVVLEAAPQVDSNDATRRPADARIHYFNSDGTPADLCGNATLCSTVMSVELGIAQPRDIVLSTPAGQITSRLIDSIPEIELQPVVTVESNIDITLSDGETRIGFAIVGIPHLVVLCEDADRIDVPGRGPLLRRHPRLGEPGANVNWVSPRADGTWRYRTFERGVEGETLACGTGAVATAVLLSSWGMAESTATIRTSSGRDLFVRLERTATAWKPALSGEGRVVFRGVIGSLHI